VSSSTKLLREYIRAVREATEHRKLWVFDFDDTLVKTDSCTHVTAGTGEKFDLTPGELAVYEKQPGDVFDYTDFEKLINPRPVKWVNRILHNVYAHHGAGNIVILTARGHSEPVQHWLGMVGLPDIEIVTLGNTSAQLKADWISERIKHGGYVAVEFFDDSHKNVAAVNALRHRHPEVEIVARHIVHNRMASAGLDS